MSTMTHTTTTRRIARAEWTKLRTLPSTWRTAALTTVMAIGFGVAVAYSEGSQWQPCSPGTPPSPWWRRPCGRHTATPDFRP